MKLYGVTCVYNEEDMIPIVMPYIEKMGYDKFVVWDNGSTDRTVELLSKYPFIEVRSFVTDNFCTDKKLRKILSCITEFNGLPKEGKEQVWVTIGDFDEVYQLNFVERSDNIASLKDYLFWMGSFGYNVCREHLWNLMEHGERVEYGFPLYWDKPNLFRLDGFKHVAISHGQHDIRITYNNAEAKIFTNTKIISAFHLKYYDHDIFVKRQTIRNNRKNSFVEGGEVITKYEGDKEKNIKTYYDHLKLSIPYSEYFSNKILNGTEEVREFLI